MYGVVKPEPYDWTLPMANCLPNTSTHQLQQTMDTQRIKTEIVSPYFQAADIKKKTTLKKKVQPTIKDLMPVKKKRERFKGSSEEEVLKKTLPDLLCDGLDIIIVGINPGLTAAHLGHHYAGPGNHFWKCLYMSGLITEPLTAYDDIRLQEYGIGFTNIVSRTTRGSSDISKKEVQIGSEILREKIRKYKPKIAVFNGKGIYEIFSGSKKFIIGKQPDPFPGTDCLVFVMPSSSARCSQLPRAIDKVPFYLGLKALRGHVTGERILADNSEIVFPDVDMKVKPRDPNAEKKPNTKRRPAAKSAKPLTTAPPCGSIGAPLEAPSIDHYANAVQISNMIAQDPNSASTSYDPLLSQSPYFNQFTNYALKAEPGETMNSIFSHSPYFSNITGIAAAAAQPPTLMHPWFGQYYQQDTNQHSSSNGQPQ